MANEKLTALTAVTATTSEDIVYIVDDPGGTPLSRKITISDLFGTSTAIPVSVNIAASASYSVAGTAILSDSAGTMTLSNVDALDATTEATIESAIDTLGNLTSASSLVTVGALNSGSITSGFGSIDIGSSALSTTGTITGPSGTWDSGGMDIAASDSYAVNGTAILSDAAGTLTLSNVDALDATTEATIEAAIDTLSNLTAASSLATVGTITSGTWNGTTVTVANGGTGATTLTDGGVLLGSGTGAVTAMAVLADSEMIVGDGTTDPVAESGATLRTSIGVAIGSDVQAFDANNAVTDVAQEYTAAQNFDATTLTDATTISWDASANQVTRVTITDNRTMAAPTNLVDGTEYKLTVIQDGTGSRTMTWNAVFKWPDDVIPTLTTVANGRDIFTFDTDGTNLFGAQLDSSPPESLELSLFGSGTTVTTGDGTEAVTVSSIMNGMNLSNVVAAVHTKGITGATDIQVRRRRAGVNADMLSTKVTIGDEFFASDEVIDGTNDDVQTGDQIYIDVDAVHSGTAPLGLSIILEFRFP